MDIKLLLEVMGAIVALVALGTAAKAVREFRRPNRMEKAKIAMPGKTKMPSRRAS